jgi:hypothetical protein
MTTLSALLKEIDAFCRDADMSEATFSKRVANDGKFIGRLRAGADLTVGKLDQVRAYMTQHRQQMVGESRRSQRPSRRKAA